LNTKIGDRTVEPKVKDLRKRALSVTKRSRSGGKGSIKEKGNRLGMNWDWI